MQEYAKKMLTTIGPGGRSIILSRTNVGTLTKGSGSRVQT